VARRRDRQLIEAFQRMRLMGQKLAMLANTAGNTRGCSYRHGRAPVVVFKTAPVAVPSLKELRAAGTQGIRQFCVS
jgi:hypothetical protein